MAQEKKNGYRILESIEWKVKEIYSYRNFIKAQVRRNLFGRYKNSYLGFAWNFITPIIYIILSYIMFAELMSNPMEDYILFLSSGIFAYTMLIGGITTGGSLFTSNSGMIKKIYFPKEILAIINATSAAIIMAIGYIIVYIMTIAMGHAICISAIPFVILILLLVIIFNMGCSLLLGSLAVYIRDIQYFMSSVTLIFFVCTPIRKSLLDASGALETIYSINPLTYFVEPMHQAIYDCRIPDLWLVGMALLLSIVIFIIGYAVFKKLKRGFVERL